MVEPAPDAPRQTKGAVQARDVGFDAGSEVAQLAIDPVALDHVHDAQAGLLVERHVADAKGLRLPEIMTASEAPVGGRLSRRLAIEADVAVKHGQEAFAVPWIAGLDHQVEDQAAAASGQVELVAVLNLTAAFDDDVGVRLEQADDLVVGGDRLARECQEFRAWGHNRADGGRIWRSRRTRWTIFWLAATRRLCFRRTVFSMS